MANRTYKIMGYAYAPTGNVSATVSVNGSQVFSGEITTSNTPREGQPDNATQLLSFELDESVSNLSVSVTVSGGEVAWGKTKTNGCKNRKISEDWVTANVPDDANASAGAQDYIADTLGSDALGVDFYNALKAGTVPNPTAEQRDTIITAAEYIDWDNDFYHNVSHLTNPQLNGSLWADWDADTMGEGNIFILQDGDTLTYTWTCDPTAVDCVLVA